MIPDSIQKLLKSLCDAGAFPVLVGGFVRDSLLGIPCDDIDIEVYGVPSLEALLALLKKWGTPSGMGKSFGVVRLNMGQYDLDFSLPRTEIKIGEGHRDFSVKSDAHLSYPQAASRRDFTINSIGYDPMSHVFLDPFNGREDLRKKKLRHIGPAFSEDPLRVLRAMQLSARLQCDIDPDTIRLCQNVSPKDLPKERLWEEFKKLFLKASKPSLGLVAADKLGILKLFPELKALQGVPQSPKWHPEGDVWAHTLMVLDEMAALKPEEPSKALIQMMAALCHDFGKPQVTQREQGRIRSIGHEQAGVAPTTTFIQKLTLEKGLLEKVIPLVREHMMPGNLYAADLKKKVSSAAIRRLSLRVPIDDLLILAKADYWGRTTEASRLRQFPAGEWLETQAKYYQVLHHQPQPFLTGKHLISLGVFPGPEMGRLLRKAFKKQVEGDIVSTETALRWVKDHLSRQK